jgi:acyl-CoA thioesterase
MARKRGRTNALQLARNSVAALNARDAMARHDGMILEAVRPGYARVRMRVRPEMLNGHQVCHGGRLFGLADAAFAYACNTYDVLSVAMTCQVSFLKAAQPGAVLTAIARERSRGSRTGVYDVEISDAGGELLVVFRGTSFSTGRPIAAPSNDT